MIGVHLIGRFGNQMFQYAHARAWAEREGRELRTNAWAGQRVFELHEGPLEDGAERLPEHYRQDQESLIYTRKQVREWFTWQPWVVEELGREEEEEEKEQDLPRVVAHVRQGDYLACGYPVISRLAVLEAVMAHGLGKERVAWVCEEAAHLHEGFHGELSFVPDFWRMTQAPVLFRGNSSFSWWAATLGEGRVFAPVIEGLQGGRVHDAVPFVEGNWPRLAELPGITDLRLREE